MTKVEFAKLADAMKTYYPAAGLLPNKTAMQLWYEELKDVPYELAAVALRKHVSTNKFPPTIAELRKNAVETVKAPQDWADGWERFRRAVSKFGYYQQEAALASMDDITRKTVKRLGWKELCMSENPMQDRANFRMVYGQEQERKSKKDVLPLGLQAQIDAIHSAGLKAIGDGHEE